MSAPALSLAALDQFAPVAPDARVFDDNLRALREQDAELADALRSVALPESWRPAATLDDWTGFRIDAPGKPPRWVGGSAAPRRRAGASLRTFAQTDRNVVLPELLGGGELRILLERLAPHQAVFVLEPDLRVLAAALRLHDYAADIARLRCIFVPPAREDDFLLALLRREAGLLPPVSLIVPVGAGDARVAIVRAICERVVGLISAERAQEWRAIAATPGAAPSPPRLAICAQSADPSAFDLARSAADGAAQLGWSVCHPLGMSEPRLGGVLPAARRIAEHRPRVVLTVGHSPRALPLPTGCSAVRWIVSGGELPERLDESAAALLAATPRISAELRRRFPTAVVHDFFLAAPLLRGQSADALPVAYVCGDLLDASAAACGVDQPTHQMIWERLTSLIAQRWESAEILRPAGLLIAAERAAGVAVADEELRARLLGILEHVLIPAVVTERIFRTLVDGGIAVRTIGRGWGRLSATPASTGTAGGQLAALPRPGAAVFAGMPEPLTPVFVAAGALGWPLHLYSPGGISREALLGSILRPGPNYLAFDSARTLAAAVGGDLADAARGARRAARTAEHLRERETYAARWRAVARDLGFPAAPEQRR